MTSKAQIAADVRLAIELVCDAAEGAEGLTSKEVAKLMEAVELVREYSRTPSDGAVGAKGAVWRNGRWHLVKVVQAYGVGPGAAHAAFHAHCSCDWAGPVRLLAHRLGVAAEDLARSDGEQHAWGSFR